MREMWDARWAGKLILALAATLLALFAAELIVRSLSPERLGFEYVDGVFRSPTEFEIDTTVNELGLHDARVGPRVEGVRRVLLLGDSFVAALSVRVFETVGQRLEHYLNAESAGQRFRVVSVGVPGWSQRDELEGLREAAELLEPDLVLTLFMPGNDVMGNSPDLARINKEQLLALRGFRRGWRWFPREAAPLFWIEGSALNQLLSHRLGSRRETRENRVIPVSYLVYAAEYDEVWERAWAETERLILEAREFTRRRGIGYAVVSASSPEGVHGAKEGLRRLERAYPAMREREWDLDKPDRRLAQICSRHGIPLLLLEPAFRDLTAEGRRLHWRYDGHWNADGNDAAGERIAPFALEHLPPRPVRQP